jgi:hypothetical protein
MRRNPGVVVAATMALVLALAAVPVAFAQAKKDSTGLERLEGTVESIDAASSTFVIRQSNRRNVNFTISYDKTTVFTYRNADATVADLKTERRVIVLGKFDQPKGTRMSAVRVDVRTGR